MATDEHFLYSGPIADLKIFVEIKNITHNAIIVFANLQFEENDIPVYLFKLRREGQVFSFVLLFVHIFIETSMGGTSICICISFVHVFIETSMGSTRVF